MKRWGGSSRMVLILYFILLSVTACRLSNCSMTTQLAFLNSLLSLLVSPASMPLQHTPQQRTGRWIHWTGTRSSGACCIRWRMLVSSDRTVCSVPSWRGCPYYETSPVFNFLNWNRELAIPLVVPHQLFGLADVEFLSDCCCTMKLSISPVYSSYHCWCIQQWRRHLETFGGDRNQSWKKSESKRMAPVQFLEVLRCC